MADNTTTVQRPVEQEETPAAVEADVVEETLAYDIMLIQSDMY